MGVKIRSHGRLDTLCNDVVEAKEWEKLKSNPGVQNQTT